MGGHQVAFVRWEINMSVILMLKEIEGVRVTLKGMQTECVSSIHTVSQEFKSSRLRRNVSWPNNADFRDT